MLSKNGFGRPTLRKITEQASAVPNTAIEAARGISGTFKGLGAAAIHLPGVVLDKLSDHEEREEVGELPLRDQTDIIVINKKGEPIVLTIIGILKEGIPQIHIKDAKTMDGLKCNKPPDNEFIIAGIVNCKAEGSVFTREGRIEASVFPISVSENGITEIMLQINPLPATPEE